MSDLVEGTTQVRYAKSNYSSDRWASDEAYLADESTVIHSGEVVDLGQELVTVTVWNNDNAHKSMACLAVNTNGDRLTEDFTITETTDKVYTVSSHFTLVEEPDIDLTIDIVYTPYFNLLFFPTFYHNTLYADGVNGGSSEEGRIVKSPANIYFDESEMTIKSNDENGTVTFYIDSFENLSKYMNKLIEMCERFVTNVDWSKFNIADSVLYTYYKPCFIKASYEAIINNLKASAKNVNIIDDVDVNDRNALYPIFVKANPDNVLYYDDYFGVAYNEHPLNRTIVELLIGDTSGLALIDVTKADEELTKLTDLMTKMDVIQNYNCADDSKPENTIVNYRAIALFTSAQYFSNTNEYELFEKNYLPKSTDNRYLTFTGNEWGALSSNLTKIDTTVDTDKTNTSNYYLVTPVAPIKVGTSTLGSIGIKLPNTPPFYSGFTKNLGQ